MKKSIWFWIISIAQLVIGVLGVASFLILATSGENMRKWIPALLFAISQIVIAVLDIAQSRSEN